MQSVSTKFLKNFKRLCANWKNLKNLKLIDKHDLLFSKKSCVKCPQVSEIVEKLLLPGYNSTQKKFLVSFLEMFIGIKIING